MILPFDLAHAVTQRHSVRTFSSEPVSDETRQSLIRFASQVESPFGEPSCFKLLDKSIEPNGEKLGTYGVVKNARTFAVFGCADTPESLLNVGYVGQCIMLMATSMELGSVWLGATFRRNAFAAAFTLTKNFIIPAIFPIGWPAEPRFAERMMRSFARSDKRKPWKDLFFRNNLQTPLSPHSAGEYAEAFELMRLAPSAVNAQPWRVLFTQSAIHFYMAHKPGISTANLRLKYIDLGIGICHFQLAAKNLDLPYKIVKANPNLDTDYLYICSIKK